MISGRHLLTAACSLAFSLGVLAAPAAAHAAAPDDLKVIQSNIGSGAECDEETVDCLAVLNEQIAGWSPDVVTAEEVCSSVRDQFKVDHPDWEVRFQPLTTAHPNCGKTPKGQLLAAPSLSNVDVYDLPGDVPASAGSVGKKDFKLLCATTSGARVCVVHLRAGKTAADNAARSKQVNKIIKITRAWAKVAIGGDFNFHIDAAPADTLRAKGYVEADERDNEKTMTNGTRKLDQIWYHRASGGVASVSGGVIDQTTSDHRLLRGSVNW